MTPIYYMDNSALLNCEPTEYVDITDELELKLKMLACHESQIKWLEDHDGNDILEDTRTFARLRVFSAVSGMQRALGYAIPTIEIQQNGYCLKRRYINEL